ncbi:MAG: flagellar hook-associated protein FlgK [Lachnospiraceae bacterium]|nr:flagellar hook-associated protein FlgK [Lachnospiraceae bacterium]
MAGTMGRMYIGTSGLQAHQNAINTTAHNLTNLNTEGYSRQQVLLSDLAYQKLGYTKVGIKQTGLGTRVEETRTTRDKYLDNKYRLQNGRQEFYQTKAGVIDEVQEYFGETEGSTFQDYMENLWKSIQEVQKTPNGLVERTSLVATASSFVNRATEIYSQLRDYQRNLNGEIQSQAEEINIIAKRIYDLNQKILKCEGGKIEAANDYKDARNQALDELSGLISIEIKEQTDGTVNVYAEEHLLVSDDRTFEIGTKPVAAGSDLLTVYWKADDTNVFNLERISVSGDNSDAGSLKGMLSARGDYTPDYTDIPLRENYGSEADYQAALTHFNRTLSNRDISSLIAQFDQLIHGMVTKINDVLCPNITVTDVSGNTYRILDTEKAGKGFGEGNEVQGTELFVRKGVERYQQQTITVLDENGTPVTKTVQVYNEENPDDYYSLYTVGQIQINDALVKDPALLPLTRVNGEEYQAVADELLELWNSDFATLDPNTLVMNDFNNYYSNMVGDFANKGYTYTNISDKQAVLVNEVNNQRQEVVGVSSDEELTNLIKYQHAYNASSRYITVVSEMIQHIIEKLGA